MKKSISGPIFSFIIVVLLLLCLYYNINIPNSKSKTPDKEFSQIASTNYGVFWSKIGISTIDTSIIANNQSQKLPALRFYTLKNIKGDEICSSGHFTSATDDYYNNDYRIDFLLNTVENSSNIDVVVDVNPSKTSRSVAKTELYKTLEDLTSECTSNYFNKASWSSGNDFNVDSLFQLRFGNLFKNLGIVKIDVQPVYNQSFVWIVGYDKNGKEIALTTNIAILELVNIENNNGQWHLVFSNKTSSTDPVVVGNVFKTFSEFVNYKLIKD